MDRQGLPYVYYKRKVLDDGVSTTYLDIYLVLNTLRQLYT